MGSWIKSRRANPIRLMASSRGHEESNFDGGVSPFVRYVIDAIRECQHGDAHKLDVKALYDWVEYEASNKVLVDGVTLHDLDQHPLLHYTPN